MKNKKNYLTLLLWIVGYQAIGYLMGQITQANIASWYVDLQKSPLTPPNITFGLVWTVLYVVLAYLGYELFANMKQHTTMQKCYIAQMLLNWVWTPIFFGTHQIGLALIVLFAMVLINIGLTYAFYSQSKIKGILSLTYQIWISFACYLNFYTWWMNT